MQPSIIIADDHPLILKGLYDFLIEKEFNVIGSANDGKEAFDLIQKHNPNIAILDIRMPKMSGLEIAEACREKNLDTKIVLITFEKSAELYYRALELKVYGYILKEFTLAEIENCLKAIKENSHYFSEEIEKQISQLDKNINLRILTRMEKKILRLIAKNKTAKDIANDLNISSRTVEKHKSNIIKKLGVSPYQNNLLIWAKENQNHLL